jgi:hypothetical protein
MMKKLLIFFVATFLSFVYVEAQSLSLSWEGNAVADTTILWVDPADGNPTSFHAIVTNISDKLINVKVLRTNIDLVDGSSNSFCFASQCYPDFMDESAAYLPLVAGDSSPEDDFHGDFISNGKLGISIVKYKFFDIANEDDFVEAVVKFWSSPEAISEEIANKVNVSDAYPNPASNKFNIDYNFDINFNQARLKIVNLLGSVVKEVEIDQNSNKLSIDISDLNAGVYFYSVVVDNEVFQTKKLVIR